MLKAKWYFVDDPALADLSDGRKVVLQDINGYQYLGFKRRDAWMTHYGTCVKTEIEQVYVIPAAKRR